MYNGTVLVYSMMLFYNSHTRKINPKNLI